MSDENNENVNEVETADTEMVEVAETENNSDDAVSQSTENSTDEDKSDEEEEVDYKAEAEKWKSLSRKNESSSKENYRRVQELETELKTLKESSTDVNSLREENLNLLKRIVASEYKLPVEASNRLIGSTEEELRKDAESLSALFGSSQKGMKPVKLHGTNGDAPGKVKIGSREEWRERNRK